MSMNFDAIGADNGFGLATWSHRDAIVYALGVGAGQEDPAAELQFTTENSRGVTQQVLPAFGVVQCMTHSKRPVLGDFQLSQVLHGEQAFTVHKPLPAEGTARAAYVVKGIYDKGKGALAVSDITLTDAETGELLMTATGGLFIKGEGGFGGEKQPVVDWPTPEREPDHELTATVRPDQALLYRLSGDRNPLHSDPKFALKAGFDRPILHGMGTYGITSRLLVNALCDGDVSRVKGMYGRFSKAVLPGETLTVSVWAADGKAQFQTRDSAGDVVLDKGTFDYTEQA
jgi:acyl dehydratase